MAVADLSPDGARIVVHASPTDKDRLVQLPGAAWRDARWLLPRTWAACLQLRAVFGAELQLGDDLRAWATRERVERVDPCLHLREAIALPHVLDVAAKLDAVEERVGGPRLRDFQRAAVGFLVTAGQACLLDAMGTGKTPTLVRTLQVLQEMGRRPLPALVVCPNSLKHTVWQRELERWAPELRVVVVDGSAGQRRKSLATEADVYVVNWDVLRLHSRLAPYGSARLTDAQRQPKELNEIAPRTTILDEAHRLRTVGTRLERQDDGTSIRVPTSQQALAAWAVSHQATYRFALTGTPADRNVEDMWGLFHGVAPESFPAKTRFIERYAQTSFGLFGGLEVLGLRPDTAAEYHAITTPLYRRVPQEVSMPQLPPVLPPTVRETPLTPKQRRAYDQMARAMLAELNELLVAKGPLSVLGRLRQLAAASAEVTDHDAAGDPIVRLTAPSTKVDDLVELLAELGDESLVVAAESRQLIELAADRLRKERVSHGLVTGAVSAYDRRLAVDGFQDGRLRVILLTLGAGAEGLTLTRARRMLFMQRSFSPMVNRQAEGRVRRVGSEGHAWIQYLHQVAPDTVEERVAAIVEGKEERIEELLRDREVVARLLGGGS